MDMEHRDQPGEHAQEHSSCGQLEAVIGFCNVSCEDSDWHRPPPCQVPPLRERELVKTDFSFCRCLRDLKVPTDRLKRLLLQACEALLEPRSETNKISYLHFTDTVIGHFSVLYLFIFDLIWWFNGTKDVTSRPSKTSHTHYKSVKVSSGLLLKPWKWKQ